VRKYILRVQTEALTPMTVMYTVFLAVTACSSEEARRFRGSYLHFYSRRLSQRKPAEARGKLSSVKRQSHKILSVTNAIQ
jgi:hypothetical protein